MAKNFFGQRPVSQEAAGTVPLANEINHLYGTTVTLLSRPTGAKFLVLKAESGNFRMQLGDTTGTLTSAAPTASVTDGSGSWILFEKDDLVLPGPLELTVVGSAADAVLTYFWV